MSKRFILLMSAGLCVATSAHAQYGGGGGGGGGRGGHGGRSRTPSTSSAPAPNPASASAPPNKPTSSIQIVGQIMAIDRANSRVTIAYEAVDALNWPAGTMPFVVSKTDLLRDLTVGEKVRFRLASQQIATLDPF